MPVPVAVRFKLMSGVVQVAGQPTADGTTPEVETYRFNFSPVDNEGVTVPGGDNFVYDTQTLSDTGGLDIGHTYRLSFEIEDSGGGEPTASPTTRRSTAKPTRE